jgi:hypothetical protein
MKRRFEITFGGRSYQVAADFGTVERIEQRFDMMAFLRSVHTYHARYRDIAWVIYCAIVEAGYKETYKEIGELVMEDVEAAAGAATDIIGAALGGGPEKPSKKKVMEPQETKETESPKNVTE